MLALSRLYVGVRYRKSQETAARRAKGAAVRQPPWRPESSAAPSLRQAVTMEMPTIVRASDTI